MNFRAKINEFVAQRRAVRELNRLSDHELADIGISRSQIRSAVFGR